VGEFVVGINEGRGTGSETSREKWAFGANHRIVKKRWLVNGEE
jgi:hypothetical protein